MANFDPMTSWAPVLSAHVAPPADALEKQARVERAVAAVLVNLSQAISLLEARNDVHGLGRLVLALAEIGGRAADAAEKIEGGHDAAMKRAE